MTYISKFSHVYFLRAKIFFLHENSTVFKIKRYNIDAMLYLKFTPYSNLMSSAYPNNVFRAIFLF